MSELALGAIVLVIAAMPAALLLLALLDVVRLGERARQLWARLALAAVVLPAAAWFGVSVWGWAGAAHLEPLCAAYATPQYYGRAEPGTRSVLFEATDGAPPPDWLRALLQDSGPLEAVEWRAPDGRLRRLTASGELVAGEPVQSAYALQWRRVTHHRNRWFVVGMERLRVADRSTGATLAEGDEIHLEAGRRTWHCGVGSGAAVTAPRAPAQRLAGYAGFLARALGRDQAVKQSARTPGLSHEPAVMATIATGVNR